MIIIKSNTQQVVALQIRRLESLADTDKMLRTCATTVLGLMKTRIHEEGKDADGKQIGTYSKGYMVIRTGAFQNAGRVSRGKNSGKLKDAGVFTGRTIRLDKQTGVFSGEEKEGKPRLQYHRTNDPKVVLSLTRQMENDMKVVAIGNGAYGIGYSSTFNYNKAIWNQLRYKRRIFFLSAEEQQAVEAIIKKFTANALSQSNGSNA